MADLGPKRIAEFIRPFRVEPGRRVRLPRDFDPAGTRQVKTREAKEILREGVELLAEYQMRLAAQDTHGVVVVLQAMDAAGKDGTIRHVMSGVNPQGVQVQQLQDPLVRGARPRLPVALRQEAAGARQHRHLQPLLLRGGPRRPRPPADPGQPEAARQAQGRGHLEAALPRDQRLGALPDRPGLPVREAVPQPLARRSSGAGSCPGSTSPRRTGSSAPTTPRSGPTGTTTRRRSARCCPRRAPTGRRGTSSRPTTSRSPGSRRPGSSPTRSSRSTRAIPQVSAEARAPLAGRQGRARGPGARRRRARPDRGRARGEGGARRRRRPRGEEARARQKREGSHDRATAGVPADRPGSSPRPARDVTAWYALTPDEAATRG